MSKIETRANQIVAAKLPDLPLKATLTVMAYCSPTDVAGALGLANRGMRESCCHESFWQAHISTISRALPDLAPVMDLAIEARAPSHHARYARMHSELRKSPNLWLASIVGKLDIKEVIGNMPCCLRPF